MTPEEERAAAIQIMRALPTSLRRTYREVNALAYMLEPLCTEEPTTPDDHWMTVSRAMLGSICGIVMGLRDALSVSAQQSRYIADLLGIEDAWQMPNGSPEDDDGQEADSQS